MHVTNGERKRLRALLAWHRKPPTYLSLLPKAAALLVVWFVLIVVYAMLAAGPNSPLMYYGLGLATFFPIYALVQIVTSVRRWRVNDAITDWQRVEQLLSRDEKPGG